MKDTMLQIQLLFGTIALFVGFLRIELKDQLYSKVAIFGTTVPPYGNLLCVNIRGISLFLPLTRQIFGLSDCSNNDPWLTLTHFMPKSNLVKSESYFIFENFCNFGLNGE